MTHNILECISSTVTDILANRVGTRPLDYATTEHKYDDDLNIIETSEEGPFQTPTHMGGTGSIPADKIERLIRLLCSQWHQALMMFHQAIQGKIYIWNFKGLCNIIF